MTSRGNGLSADPHPRFVKLVRDRIGKFLGSSEVIYSEATDGEFIAGLRKKLVEEACEYLLDPSVGELADVLEVVRALAHHDLRLEDDQALSFSSLQTEAWKKRQERGGFDAGVAMFVYSTAPARHEGEHAA